MAFRDLKLKGVYRTSTDSLVRDFYVPALAQAKLYDRAVGYFSSSMLTEAALGISGLVKNKGKMRLLIGNELSDDDWDAVRQGSALASVHLQLHSKLIKMLNEAGSPRSVHSFELLSWMVATEAIEIKYAFRSGGMYHEKVGVLIDSIGDSLVFHGSANESASALLPERNFESFAVYPSWNAELFREYGRPFVDGFDALWNNATDDVISVPVPSEFYSALINYRKNRTQPPDLELEVALASLLPVAGLDGIPRLPETLAGRRYELRPHQENALRKWQANSYGGILALATGSGKTVIALHTATRISQQQHRIALVVAVPFQVLAEQWATVMSTFGMKPIKAMYSRASWEQDFDKALAAFRANAVRFVAVVVVNQTLASPEFQRRISSVSPSELFFVGDECHHHASDSWKACIPAGTKYRLGLSATPWNPGQLHNRNNLEALYGPVVATYNLKDAIADGTLCTYRYSWLPCRFDDEEAEEYERLSLAIAMLSAQDPDRSDASIQAQVRAHFARRARLVGALRSKLVTLERLLDKGPTTAHTLFYCGEGRHPLEDEAIQQKEIDSVTDMLSRKQWVCSRITARETVAERQRILAQFENGFIQAIAAIRVLDEGFDIPGCRTAYLVASSSSHRQYVQRRGRVLRRAPGKDEAMIYDFVALPTKEILRSNAALWRRQVETELVRIREFVQLSTNSDEQQFEINSSMSALGLGSIFYEAAPIEEEDLYGEAN